MNLLTILMACLVLALLLLLTLVLVLWHRSQSLSLNVTLSLLSAQQVENQSLRNQLRSPDVNTLLGLQHATLPSQATESNDLGSQPVDVSDAFVEEALARQGYSQGDLDDGLNAAGWPAPVIKRNADGDPIAYDV